MFYNKVLFNKYLRIPKLKKSKFYIKKVKNGLKKHL